MGCELGARPILTKVNIVHSLVFFPPAGVGTQIGVPLNPDFLTYVLALVDRVILYLWWEVADIQWN